MRPHGARGVSVRNRRFAGAGSDSLPSSEIGAVVIGGDYQGLGVVRSLGRRGVPLCVIDDERSIARFSRYVGRSERVRTLREEHEIVATLLEVGTRLGLEGWALFPTREELVAAISRNRAVLSEFFRVPTADWRAVKWAWDKRNTYRLAEQCGIPVPRTWYPETLADVRAIDAELPLVIKPAIKENFIYATRKKAWRADTREQLETLFESAVALVGPGEVMIQERIPGDGRHQLAYCAFFKNGHAVGSMVARRGRQHPPEFGRASTFVQTVDLPELETLSHRFLRAIDYYGLVEVEFKHDARDGRYKLLDVNARTWGYHSLGQAAGVDFPALVFADQMGERIEDCRARPGVGWMRIVTDLPTAAFELVGGRLDWRAYVRSLRAVDVEATFVRDDLLPAVAELALVPYLALKRGM